MRLAERRIDPKTDVHLEPWINYIQAGYHQRELGGIPVVREIPNFDRHLDKYKSTLENVQVDKSSYELNHENLSLIQQLPGGLGHFNLIWDIEKARQHIKRHRVPAQPVPLENIAYNAPFGTLGTITHQPIIVVSYELNEGTNQPYLCIDGNHRISFARMMGESTISAHILSSKTSIECLINGKYRLVYKILVNLNRMTLYMLGQLNERQLKLYPVP